MLTTNFNVRGITPELMLCLEYEAKQQNISVNLLIIKLIEQGIGYSHKVKKFHELDNLAGNWSVREVKRFKKNIKSFEQIDPNLWS